MYNVHVHFIMQGVRIRTWVPNMDTPDIYCIKRLIKIKNHNNIYNHI